MFVATYVDDEGDEISVSDDEDLRTAASFAAQHTQALKLQVRHVDEPHGNSLRLHSIPTVGLPQITERTNAVSRLPQLNLNPINTPLLLEQPTTQRPRNEDSLFEETVSLDGQLEFTKVDDKRQKEKAEDVYKQVRPQFF